MSGPTLQLNGHDHVMPLSHSPGTAGSASGCGGQAAGQWAADTSKAHYFKLMGSCRLLC